MSNSCLFQLGQNQAKLFNYTLFFSHSDLGAFLHPFNQITPLTIVINNIDTRHSFHHFDRPSYVRMFDAFKKRGLINEPFI